MIYRRSTISYFINLLARDYSEKTALIWKTKYRTKKIKYLTLLKLSKKVALFRFRKYGSGHQSALYFCIKGSNTYQKLVI